MSRLITVLLLIIGAMQVQVAQGGVVGRAYKLAQKGKAQKALKLTNQALAKDSTLAPALFVKAYIYSQKNTIPATDTAQQLVMQAQANWHLLPNKKHKKYARHGISPSAIAALHGQIDSLAFAQAHQNGTEEAYNHFLKKYPKATKHSQAINLRDSVAFGTAEQEGTYKAYRHFLKKYPNARQAPEASRRYDKLVFESITESGELEDLERFIKQYPTNRYTPEVKKRIYQLSTLPHSTQAYQNYIKKHPNSPYIKRAYHWLLTLQMQYNNPLHLRLQMRNYPTTRFAEWMRNAAGSLLPFYMVNSYGMLRPNGSIAVAPTFTTPPNRYDCLPMRGAYITGKQGPYYGATDALGRVTIPFRYKYIAPLSAGAVVVYTGTGYGAMALAGFEILPPVYKEIGPVGSHLIKAKKSHNYALFSYQGQALTGFEFTHIDTVGAYLVFTKGQLKAVSTIQNALDHQTEFSEMAFQYHDVSATNNNLLLVRTGTLWGIINQQMQQVQPFLYNKITPTPWGYVAQMHAQSSGATNFFLLKPNGKHLSKQPYQAIRWNQYYYLCKKNNKWGIMSKNGQLVKPFTYDSVAVISPQVTWFTIGGQSYISFRNNEWVDFSDYPRVVLLSPAGATTGLGLLRVTDRNQKLGLYKLNGTRLLPNQYDDIELLQDNLLVVTQNGLTGLCDTLGNWLLQPKYQAAGAPVGKHINVLQNRKFGLYHPQKGWVVKPQYQSTLRAYGNDTASVFIALKNEYYGLVSYLAKQLIPFEFEEIIYFKKDTALVKQNRKWMFYDINQQDTIGPVFERIRTEIDEKNNDFFVIGAKGSMVGLVSAQQGVLLLPAYDEIMPMPTTDGLLWLTGKPTDRPEFFEVSYYNSNGQLLRTETVNLRVYDALFCDD